MSWRIYQPKAPPLSATNIGGWVYEQFRQLGVSLLSLPVQAESTTTALSDAGAPINTTEKYAGKQVYNQTTGLPLWASGPAATDTWDNASGVTQHTPS